MSEGDYQQWLDDHLWRPTPDSGLEVVADISPAEWIGEHLRGGSFQVGIMVPDCFEAYARIFFPFVGDHIYDDHGQIVDNERITWTQLAARNGKLAHSLMEAETISATDDGHEHPLTLYSCLSDEQ